MRNLLKSNLVDPSKSPFFYGYIILVIGTVGVYFSIPGQTIGVSVFTDPVKDALGMSRNQFSNAYMIGTICSSLLIGRAGVWFDRYGARLVAFFATLALSITVLCCSWSLRISTFFKELFYVDTWLIPFLVMSCLFFLLRFAGQGVLTMASRNMIMIWFDKNRGKANMFSSVALSFGFSSSPLWISALIDARGWQIAWQYLALALLVFSVFVYFFYKNTPEEHKLLPDGKSQEASNKKGKETVPVRSFTLKEAKTTRSFWMYALALSFNSFFITGLTFHIISVFETEDFLKEEAIAIFLPASVVAVTISSIFNYTSDYVSLQLYLYAMLLGGILSALGLLYLSSVLGVPLLIAGIGIMGGFFAVLNAIVWPRFYGRNHLGAVTGKVMAFLILASALAPSIFSLCFSMFASYRPVGILALVFLAFLAISSLKAGNPQKN